MPILQRILFLIINSLFVAKYTIRLGYSPIATVIIYCLFALSIMWLLQDKQFLQKKNYYKIGYCFTLLFIVFGILGLHYIINPLSLQVDRWSAIHNFIQSLFNGDYPYAAQTHLGGYGSPFPVWQIFHIPFYCMGNIGFGMVFSVLLTAILLVWLLDSYKKALAYLLLLAASPAFWYEAAVRSDLLYNFILVFLAIATLYKKNYSIQKHALRIGILCGLFLSTRLSIVIPFAVFLLPSFWAADTKHKFTFALSAFSIFALTFLPFAYWNFDTLFFFKYNPFVLQTRQGSFVEIGIMGIMGIALSTRWKNNFNHCVAYISICLITLVITTFLHRMISTNFENNLFDSAYDICYFTMSLPFVIFAMKQNTIKK